MNDIRFINEKDLSYMTLGILLGDKSINDTI